MAPNPADRADGNRKQRGSPLLIGISLGAKTLVSHLRSLR